MIRSCRSVPPLLRRTLTARFCAISGEYGDPMGFLDFFRPSWKHSNVDVRSEAVRRLDAQDAAILAKVARNDGDPKVRRIALKKIDSPELLTELGQSDPDEA